MGRATQGVKLIRLNEKDSISAVEKISNIEEDEEIIDPENTAENGDATNVEE